MLNPRQNNINILEGDDMLGYHKIIYTSRNGVKISSVNHQRNHWVATKNQKSWNLNCEEKMVMRLYPPISTEVIKEDDKWEDEL